MAGTETVAIQGISEAVTLAGMALELLNDIRDILKSSDDLRSDLQHFGEYLERVSRTYKVSINIIGDDGTLSSQLRRHIQGCREPCEEIVKILIRIKSASPVLRYFVVGRARGDLQRLRSQLNDARRYLHDWMNLISEERNQAQSGRAREQLIEENSRDFLGTAFTFIGLSQS